LSIYLEIALIIISACVYAAGVWYFRRRRAWLGYYLFATVGMTLLLVFGSNVTGLAGNIEYIVTWLAAETAKLIGISAVQIGESELMVADQAGWVVLKTTIECSAVIETSVLFALVVFYPAFDWKKKSIILAIGMPVTWLANVARLLIITSMTAFIGRQAVFFGHAIVGRLFFLIVTVVLYWYILTKPTVKEVGERLEGG
jgi:exosortase family protein XrtG